jgi:hypothetical protein
MTRFRPLLSVAMAATALVFAGRSYADPPRLTLRKDDRIVIVGNTLAERMQQFGNLETLLYGRFADLDLVVRDLGWSADELTVRMRSQDFQDHGHNLTDHKPTVLVACYGFNESFAGPAGLAKFEQDLEKFIKESTTTAYDGVAPPRLVLVSPIAHEDLHRRTLPTGRRTTRTSSSTAIPWPGWPSSMGSSSSMCLGPRQV